MALVSCPSCSKQIAEDATTCPKCGQPLSPGWAEKRRQELKAASFSLAVLIAVVVVGWGIYSVFGSSDAEKPNQEDAKIAQDMAAARKVCAAFESTGELTEKCSVSGYNIDIHVDLTTEYAQALCTNISLRDVLKDPRWTVRIFSPYSGDHPVATCSY